FVLERLRKYRPLRDHCLSLMQRVKRSDNKVAAQALQRIADILKRPALATLVESLKDQSYVIRKVAAFALGEMGEAAEAAIPALISAIRDAWGPNRYRETDVGWRAAEALGQIGPAAVPALIAVLRENQCPMAARALGIIGPKAKEAVPVLIDALRASGSGNRFAAIAVESLRKIDPEAAVKQ